MIVEMKKVTVLVRQQDAESTVERLRSLGVVHVEHQQSPQAERVSLLKEELVLIDSAQEILLKFAPPHIPADQDRRQLRDWKLTARHIVDLRKRFDHLQEYSRMLGYTIGEWEYWGDFDPAAVKGMAERSIYLRLYEVPLKEMEKFPAGVIVQRCGRKKGMFYCVVVSRERVEIPFKEIEPPRMGLEEMKKRLEEDSRMIATLKNDLKDLVRYFNRFSQIRQSLRVELEFYEAVAGMGQTRAIGYLRGYIPVDTVEALTVAGRSNQWGLIIDDPSSDDAIPTLIRTPRWVGLIKPVFRLLGIIPGYYELDTSPLFFIFLSCFFGVLIGDAGYGSIYLLLTMWMQKKMGDRVADKGVFYLCYVLSSCAIIWGLLTATFFGQSWLTKFTVQPLAPALNNPQFMQTLCFFIGALHLSIAHSWRAVLKFPSAAFLAELGWIGVLWTAFFLARALILSAPFLSFTQWLLLAGSVGMVILFTNPQKNVLKAIGEGLGALALSLMNNFTDVVSYVRLFAVGLAGVAIAETTNTMAASLGSGPVAVLGGALILMIGHGLNIILGPMSVLVHGVRLNVLEFSGHASVTWSGFAYQPLKE